MKIKLLLVITTLSFSLGSFGQWTVIPSGTSAKLDGIHFIDGQIGYCSGGFTNTLETTDGGNTWVVGDQQGIRDFSFVDNTFGFGASRVGESMSRTTDGGVTWTAITPPTSNSLWAVSATSSTTAYFVGTGGVLWKTTNGGSTVTVENSGTIDLLTDIFFTTNTTGHLVVQTGELKRSTNSGNSWNTVYNQPGILFTEMHFVNENVGYVVGSSGTVVKTTDGGTTWNQLTTNTDTYFQGVHFLNENTGIVVGTGGDIFVTTDGGANWIKQNTGTSTVLYDVRLISASTAVAVGDDGMILKNDNLLSVEELNPDLNISVSPNPFQDSVVIKTNLESIINISFYDVLGKLIYQQNGRMENEQAIDTAGMNSGLYLVRVETSSGTVTKKLVKL